MKKQDYINHIHWVPLYHFVTLPAMVILIVLCIFLADKNPGDRYLFYTIVLLVILLGSVSFHCRSFALKAQDRIIILEQNFRHYRLTGMPLDPQLKVPQILALRFADDSEFLELCKKAVDQNLSNKQIKQSITAWQPDYLRA